MSCASCGKSSDELKQWCPHCNSISYCGAACMKSHRSQHKKICRNLCKKNAGKLIFQGKELRFGVGDVVSCQVAIDEWEMGKICQCLYKERGQVFAYQVQSNDESIKIKIPVDDNMCIREATKKSKLRFNVGDRVACRCGEWVHGAVVKLWWYDCMEEIFLPYQVKLDDGSLVSAPEDDDRCIQKSIPSIDPENCENVSPFNEESVDAEMSTVDIVSEELRFKAGDRVQCQTDRGWEPGYVIKLWHEERDDVHPYQVRLDSMNLVYAPIDSDHCIKSSTLPPPAGLFVEDDDPLFKDPVPLDNECPICFQPFGNERNTTQPCCGKIICQGCIHAASTFVDLENGRVVRRIPCPFCRIPGAKDADEIISRLNKRVEIKDPVACSTLGGFYKEGEHGLEKNYERAFELYVLAEKFGSDHDVDSRLGWAYWKGEGVERDLNKAKHYFQRSALKGDIYARGNLAIIEEKEGNPWKAYKHFLIAAKFGLDGGMKKVKQGYVQGFVSKEEFSIALYSFQKAVIDKSSAHREKAAIYDAYQRQSEKIRL